MPPSGLFLIQPAGGKVAPSNPSTRGNAPPAPREPVTVAQSFDGSETAAPFGADEHMVIVFAPNTNGTGFNVIVCVPNDGIFNPVRFLVSITEAFLVTITIADVSVFEPAFLNVTVKGIVGSQ